MSFADFQERLSRSIKVVGLPNNYEKEDIIENLKNAGTIEDTKLGPNEMIVTYSNSNEKDLSKMYDGCPIGDYVLKLEDPTSFEFGNEEAPVFQEKVEPKQPEPEAPATYTHYEPQAHETHETHHQEEPAHHFQPQEPEKVQEVATEPVRETLPEPIHEPVAEPVHHHVEPVVQHHEPVVHHVEPVQHQEPVVHHVEPVQHHVEPVQHHVEPVQHHVEPVQQHVEPPKHHEPEPVHVAPVQEKVEKVEKVEAPAVVERKPEPQPERRTETVHTEKRAEVAPAAAVERKVEPAAPQHVARGGESSKDLLRELQNTNLPARAGLPTDDLFQVVTKRSYLLIFTMVWALQLFLRSVF